MKDIHHGSEAKIFPQPEQGCRPTMASNELLLEMYSRLLKGGYIGDSIGSIQGLIKGHARS